MRLALPLVLVVSLLLPVAADAKAPPAEVGTTFTFGTGLGAIKPFVSAKEVRGLLGKPNKTVRANGALAWLDYRRKYGFTVFFKTNSPDSGVFSVKAYKRGFTTVEGLAIGDPAAKVGQLYPGSTCGADVMPVKRKKIQCTVTSVSPTDGYEYASDVIVGSKGRVKALEVGLLF